MLRYKEIKRDLAAIIADTPPGGLLPSRPALCQRLDTTRATLDKAMKELEAEGVVVSRKGSGTRVACAIDGAVDAVENWCVILPNVMEDIYPGMVRSIENFAQQRNTNIILCNSDNNAAKQEGYIRRLMFSGVDGFIIVPVVSADVVENYRLYGSLVKSQIPFVFCNRSVEGIRAPVVKSNDFYGGYIATKHLLARGYRRIAFVAKQRYQTSLDRCQGYISALLEAGLPINRRAIMLETLEGEQNTTQARVEALLREENPPDAVFCFNDYVARDVYKAAASCGLAISRQLGVIGYDNTGMCKDHTPPISSVSYKNTEIGEKAAELLWALSHGETLSSDFEYYLFQPVIVDRESCRGPGL